MPRRVYDKNSGKMVWVGDDGKPLVNYNPGMGSLPGQALRREADLLSRLPDAQLAGYTGPSVVDPQPVRGARPDDPAPVPPHTYRPLAGAKENNRGNSVLLSLPPAIGVDTTMVLGTIVETAKQSGDDAESIKVICGFAPQGDVNPAEEYNLAGTLEFGIGGATFSAEFDWRNGTCFSVPASFLRVKGVLTYTNLLVERDIVVTAALAYGEVGGGLAAPLKRSFFFKLNPGDTSLQMAIPNFASGVTVVTSGPPASNVQLQLISPGFMGNLDVLDMTNLANQRDGLLPVHGGASRFQVVNNCLAWVGVQVIFTLSL